MKNFFYILILVTFFSCDSLEFQKKDKPLNNKPIATVYDESLFKEDLNLLLPKNIDKNDKSTLDNTCCKLSYKYKKLMRGISN